MRYLLDLTEEEFKKSIADATLLAIKQSKEQEIQKKDEYLTRYEISKEIHVSYPTLNRLDKEGILKARKLGGRVLYLRSDVEKALIQDKPIKYRRV